MELQVANKNTVRALQCQKFQALWESFFGRESFEKKKK
jgi:hypothetical protein